MYVEIGAYLRQAREAIGLTLDDVQEKTKIQKSFLVAIENGDFDKLPSPFYVRTYLRYYANCVKVEPHHILRQYRKAEQAVRYGMANERSSSNTLQNTARIPIININTGPQQSVAQTTGKNPVRRINAQTALTIAKVPQTTGTNPKLSSPAQAGGQRFASGPQQVIGNTQKLPTIAARSGQAQAGQTTQKLTAVTQKLPSISKVPPTADSGRFRSNLQNTGSHSLFQTKEQKIPESLSAMAGQAEAAASAEQKAQTNPNLRFPAKTHSRMQTNPRVGLEHSNPPQRTGSPSLLDNTLGKTSRMRRAGGLQNTMPPQPPAREPEMEETQSAKSYRRGGTRKESGFSIPKNRFMPIAITVAVLFVSILGVIFLFGNDDENKQAHPPDSVGQKPVQPPQVKQSDNNENNNTSNNNTKSSTTEVRLDKVPEKKATYNLIGTDKVEIEVIPIKGECYVLIKDAHLNGKILDEKKVEEGRASYKYSITLNEKDYDVYIKLGIYQNVKVKINGEEIESAPEIRIKLPQYD